MKGFFFFLIFSGVFQYNAKTFGQESHLTEALFQNIVIINCLFEDFFIRQEGYFCSCLFRITDTNLFQRIHGMTSLITLLVLFTLAADCNLQPLRQCIYNRCTYAVETTGYLVPSTAKLTTRMKDGKYNLDCRYSGLVVDTNRDTSSVISYCNGIIRIDDNLDLCTKSS